MSLDPNTPGPPAPVPAPAPGQVNPGTDYQDVIVKLTAPAHEDFNRNGKPISERRFKFRAWFLPPLAALAALAGLGAYWSWTHGETARGYRSKIENFSRLEGLYFAARNQWRTLAERQRVLKNPVRQSTVQREIQTELSLKPFLGADEREAAARAVQVRTDMEEDLSSIYAEIESGESDKRASFFGGLREKYERALQRPWESVDPDPAWPVD